MSPLQPDDDDALDQAITAANLLDTIAFLCAKSCQLAAQTGDTEEWGGHADYTALCLSRLAQTRTLAKDFMETATAMARRRIGADVDLTALEYVEALTLTGAFADRVLARMPRLAGSDEARAARSPPQRWPRNEMTCWIPVGRFV